MGTEQISKGADPVPEFAADRYRVRSVLGRGGFATVYLADDLDRERPVVVKVLSEFATSASDPAGLARFRSEIAATRELEHHNVVKVLDEGITSDRRPYLVTEYTPGRSLSAVLRDSGRLTTPQAIDVAIGIAQALAYVHGKGVVHRDLKPSNILIPGWPETPDFKNPKLLDFGVAGRLEQGGRTQAGMIFGTLRYMSPEQINGDEQSAATDVYGFGLLLYEMLAGSAPVKRDQDLTTLLIAIHDGISKEDLKRIEPGLADLIWRCVKTNPAERPAMADVLHELKASPHRSVDDARTGVIAVPFDLPAPAAARPAPPPAPQAAGPAQQLIGTTLLLKANPDAGAPLPSSVPASAPHVASRSRRSISWIILAAAVALLAVAAIIYFRPAQPAPAQPATGQTVSKMSPAQGDASAPPASATPAPNDTAIRSVRFAAGLLLMAASLVIGFSLRRWLGSRSDVKAQTYQLVFGARARTDMSATIALQLQDLVSNLRSLDQRILAGTVALMLDEYGKATDTTDRQAALMNVVALSEKLAVRLSPWYERYKEVIASAVAVMGGVSGLMTAINSVLAHKH